MPSPFLIQTEDPYDYKQIKARPRSEADLTIPDDSYTIGELFNRYQAGESLGTHRRGKEDNDLHNPLRYDADLDSRTTAYEITYDTYSDRVDSSIDPPTDTENQTTE